MKREGRTLRAALLVAAPLTIALTVWRGATRAVADPDGWWVAAAGRRLIESGAVMRTNGWSFTAPDHPWVMHEWALGPLYAVGLAAGPLFFSIVSATVGLGLVGLVFVGARSNRGVQLAAATFFAALFGPAAAFSRPSVIGLLFAGAMAGLANRERFERRHLALVLVVQWAWTQTHGSFPVGWVLLGWSALAFDADADRRRRVLALVGAVAVTALNPYGLALHELVFGYATGGGGGLAWARADLVEFRSIVDGGFRFPHRSEWVGVVVLTCGAAAALTLGGRARRRGVLVLAFVALACVQVRHTTLAGLVGTIVLAPVLAEPLGSVELRRPALVFVPAIVLGLVGLTFGGRPSAGTGGERLPALVAELPDGASVFAPFHLAGRLVWEGDPRGVRVFYDSRNDCYPASVARAAAAVEREGRLAPLESVPFAIASRDSPLERALRDAGWETRAATDDHVLFARVRTERANTHTPATRGSPITGR